jgi:hypothetical protein
MHAQKLSFPIIAGMIRTVLIPDSKSISIEIPEDFVGRRVEVIVSAMDQVVEQNLADNPITHYASTATLAKDWLNPLEDEAWQDL